MGPRSRLPAALRVLIALGALAAIAGVVALMWSDRAPGLLMKLFGARVEPLWARIDGRIVSTGQVVPQPDFVVHVVSWGFVTLLIAMVVWTYAGAIVTGVLVWVGSILVEFGQRRYATSRNFEFSDLVANTTGVVLGTIFAFVLFAFGSLLARIVHSLTGRSRRPPR